MLARARARGMIVDLAHASARTITDFLARPDRGPFVVSDTGVNAVCPTVRTLSDAQIRAIVEAGGLIGLGAWNATPCLTETAPQAAYLDRMVAAIGHVVAISGAIRPDHPYDYVALGSDFDGWVQVAFDATGWPLLTQALLRAGYPRDAIAAIMGGNVCRFLLRTLPDHGEPPDHRRCMRRQGSGTGL